MANENIHISDRSRDHINALEDDGDNPNSKAVLLIIVAAVAFWVIVLAIVVSVWLTPAQAAGATYARLHDGRTLIMPPAAMRAKIERQFDKGTAPAVMEVSRAVLRKRCTGYHPAWTGCTVIMGRTPVMAYIVSGLDAHDHRIVLVHELAHYLYGWQHR